MADGAAASLKSRVSEAEWTARVELAALAQHLRDCKDAVERGFQIMARNALDFLGHANRFDQRGVLCLQLLGLVLDLPA